MAAWYEVSSIQTIFYSKSSIQLTDVLQIQTDKINSRKV